MKVHYTKWLGIVALLLAIPTFLIELWLASLNEWVTVWKLITPTLIIFLGILSLTRTFCEVLEKKVIVYPLWGPLKKVYDLETATLVVEDKKISLEINGKKKTIVSSMLADSQEWKDFISAVRTFVCFQKN